MEKSFIANKCPGTVNLELCLKSRIDTLLLFPDGGSILIDWKGKFYGRPRLLSFDFFFSVEVLSAVIVELGILNKVRLGVALTVFDFLLRFQALDRVMLLYKYLMVRNLVSM